MPAAQNQTTMAPNRVVVGSTDWSSKGKIKEIREGAITSITLKVSLYLSELPADEPIAAIQTGVGKIVTDFVKDHEIEAMVIKDLRVELDTGEGELVKLLERKGTLADTSSSGGYYGRRYNYTDYSYGYDRRSAASRASTFDKMTDDELFAHYYP